MFKIKRRYRFLLLLPICLICSCSESLPTDERFPGNTPDGKLSTEITFVQAQNQLESLLSDLEEQATRSGQTFKPRKIIGGFSTGSPVTRSVEEAEPYVHIINFEDSAGFAVMSGDERVPALIALANEGTITPETVVDNPGLIAFLANMETYYQQEIDMHEAYASSQPAGTHIEYGPWGGSMFGMLYGHCRTKWDQYSPSNDLCPKIDGESTLAGCIPVAVGQLMSIYKYPESYNGYNFNWTYMINSYYAGRTQIAYLMQQLGLPENLNVEYGVNGSSANRKNIPKTLENFGYSSGGIIKDYDIETVVAELSQGYPILIGGNAIRTTHYVLGIPVAYTYSEGHSWLAHGLILSQRAVNTCDQYGMVLETRTEKRWYPLCNWGWKGKDDGYYLSGAFDTNQGPIPWESLDDQTASRLQTNEVGDNSGTKGNYQYNITAITGIRK